MDDAKVLCSMIRFNTEETRPLAKPAEAMKEMSPIVNLLYSLLAILTKLDWPIKKAEWEEKIFSLTPKDEQDLLEQLVREIRLGRDMPAKRFVTDELLEALSKCRETGIDRAICLQESLEMDSWLEDRPDQTAREARRLDRKQREEWQKAACTLPPVQQEAQALTEGKATNWLAVRGNRPQPKTKSGRNPKGSRRQRYMDRHGLKKTDDAKVTGKKGNKK